MPNDIKLGDSHPATEDKYPLKVGGEVSSLEIAKTGNGAKVTGDLEVTGNIDRINSTNLRINDSNDITLAPRANHIYFNNTSFNVGEIDIGTLNTIKLQSSTDKHLNLVSQGTGDVVIDSSGDVVLDSADGNFIAKKAGTEFSVANSAYAGMILGYRVIGEDVTAAHSGDLGTSFATIHDDCNVTFKAPPSGNVEITVQAYIITSSNAEVIEFALSTTDTTSFTSLGVQYEQKVYQGDRSEDGVIQLSWVVTGLTAGAIDTYWLAAEATTGNTRIYWGGDATSDYPVFIMKVTALPAAVTDYAVYG